MMNLDALALTWRYFTVYFRLSIYREFVRHDNAHSTTITMIKLRSTLHSRTTPHTSPLRASYGVSFASYITKNDRDISRAHCIDLCLFLQAQTTGHSLTSSAIAPMSSVNTSAKLSVNYTTRYGELGGTHTSLLVKYTAFTDTKDFRIDIITHRSDAEISIEV